MALFRRGKSKIWHFKFSFNGKTIQRSTGTIDKLKAKEYEDHVKNSLWRTTRLGEKPDYLWRDAVVRWIKEMSHKKSLDRDKSIFRCCESILKYRTLKEIDKEVIVDLRKYYEDKKLKSSTIDRHLCLIKSVLNRAVQDWEWLDKAPVIKLKREDNRRKRWLKYEEFKELLMVLKPHARSMALFSVITGLRAGNVKRLTWDRIDFINRHAYVESNDSKNKIAIPVYLNDHAIEVLKEQSGQHPVYVFTYQGQPVKQHSTKAWRKALEKANIKDFQWHDLRHTWASWHIQNGTTLQELQILGGWKTSTMVLHYAHLSSQHLKAAADRLNKVTKSAQGTDTGDKNEG